MTKRLHDALAIRDAVLKSLLSEPLFKKHSTSSEPTDWRASGFDAMYISPSQWPQPYVIHTPAPGGFAKVALPPDAIPHCLNIWPSGAHKVLNIEWNARHQVFIRCFRRGPWEHELLKIVTRDRVGHSALWQLHDGEQAFKSAAQGLQS